MRVPDHQWAPCIVTKAVNLIETDLSDSSCKQQVVTLAKEMSDVADQHQSAESFAIGIGTQAYIIQQNTQSKYFVRAIDHETDGEAGEELAKGYIGTKALDCMFSNNIDVLSEDINGVVITNIDILRALASLDPCENPRTEAWYILYEEQEYPLKRTVRRAIELSSDIESSEDLNETERCRDVIESLGFETIENATLI